MSLAKRISRRRKRTAHHHQVPAGSIEQSLKDSRPESRDEIAVEGMDLSDSLRQIGAEQDLNSFAPPEIELDNAGFAIVELLDDPYLTEIGPEDHHASLPLVDTSSWFEHNDDDAFEMSRAEHQEATLEDCSADVATTGAPEAAAFATSPADAGLSTPEGVVSECAAETVDSSADHKQLALDERRRHLRESSSDLVWVEYFDSSNESIAREAARVENVSAGGMRVAVKSARTEVERVIVSYPYRGFESCSIVRSSYQGEDGQQHLCLEFADRGWKVNSTCPSVADQTDQVDSRKILLADDDAPFRKIVGNILIKAGYDLVLAEDGEMAVRKAKSENPDLVLTDGLMPKLHGFQVCKAIKEFNPRAKVIMLTAVYTSPNYLWEAHAKFGADDVITKPFQVADLLRKIEKHMPACRQFA